MNLVTVSAFKVRHEHLKEVEDFDSCLVGEIAKWDAMTGALDPLGK
jgi:hypothetical protein